MSANLLPGAEKALRLIGFDGVRVKSVLRRTNADGSDGGLGSVQASVVGDHAVYDVTYLPDPQGWACTCPARGLCAHLTAVALVTGIQ